MTAPVPDYLASARACYDLAGFRRVWTKAKEQGHLDDVLRARLTPIGEALANAEMTAAPELSPAEAARVAAFDRADPAPEAAVERVAAAMFEAIADQPWTDAGPMSRDGYRIEAHAAIDTMKASAR